MTTNETARSRGMSLVGSAVSWAVRLLIFGFIGWLCFLWAADSAWRAVSLAAVLALAALAGITGICLVPAPTGGGGLRWMLTRKQEQAKRTYSRRNIHARLSRKLR